MSHSQFPGVMENEGLCKLFLQEHQTAPNTNTIQALFEFLEIEVGVIYLLLGVSVIVVVQLQQTWHLLLKLHQKN